MQILAVRTMVISCALGPLNFDMLKSSTRGFAIVMNVSFSSSLTKNKLTTEVRQKKKTIIAIQLLTLAIQRKHLKKT